MDLFNNPVGYCGLKSVTSPAISRPNATLWGYEIAFLAEVVQKLKFLNNSNVSPISKLVYMDK
jgi:hypothetical protein